MSLNNAPEWKICLTHLLDPAVSEVTTNGPNEFFIKKSGKRIHLEEIKLNDEERYTVGIEEGLLPATKPISQYKRGDYLYEAPLDFKANGQHIRGRVHVVLPPAADSPQVTIAKKSTALVSLEAIAEKGSMSMEMLAFIKASMSSSLTMAFSGGTGAGKALTLDTKIPTPAGWTTMGEIKPGDKIFDHNGDVGVVLHKFPQTARQVYEVTFNTGEKIYCDAEHNWYVSTLNSRRAYEHNSDLPYYSKKKEEKHPHFVVKTVKEMIEEGKHHRYGMRNFNVPVLSNPIIYENEIDIKDLPIHPYLLGLWLGDGESRGSRLYAHKNDRDEYVKIFKELGIESELHPGGSNGRTWNIGIKGLVPSLRSLSILQDKRKDLTSKKKIPNIYLHASVESRILLLQGIMDSDGSSLNGEFVFSNTNEELIDGVIELASSLGLRPTIGKASQKNLDGDRLSKPVRKVYIPSKYPLVRLPRKIRSYNDSYLKIEGTLKRDRNRVISSIEIVPGRVEEMACISVSTKDSTYLIGKTFIPTHNTTMLEACSKLIPDSVRIGVAEDSPELSLLQPNVTYLHSFPWRPGMDPNDVATLDWVVAQFQRMRTDRLIIGETRGKEFAGFLVAANSGMEGSLTTIHANTPKRCLEKMTNFALKGSERQPVRAINTDIANAIDIIVQLIILPDGRHKMGAIEEITTTLSNDESASITTNKLYEYDPVQDVFIKSGQMTDHLRKTFIQKGVDVSQFLASKPGAILPVSNFNQNSTSSITPTSNRGLPLPGQNPFKK